MTAELTQSNLDQYLTFLDLKAGYAAERGEDILERALSRARTYAECYMSSHPAPWNPAKARKFALYLSTLAESEHGDITAQDAYQQAIDAFLDMWSIAALWRSPLMRHLLDHYSDVMTAEDALDTT